MLAMICWNMGESFPNRNGIQDARLTHGHSPMESSRRLNRTYDFLAFLLKKPKDTGRFYRFFSDRVPGPAIDLL